MDWRWRELEVAGGDEPPTGRYGHSCISVDATHLLVIGGKTGVRGQIQVYLLSTNQPSGELTWTQLHVSPDQDGPSVVTQRWAMASCFVEEKQFIFLHGGFDSEYNYGDTWLLKPRQKHKKGDCSSSAASPSGSAGGGVGLPKFASHINNLRWCRERNTPPRAYHTAVAHRSIVYVFGGQCCVGGPYDYFNSLLAFDFSNGPAKISPVSTTGNGPSPRSQCSSVIYDNAIYILFGYTETQTLDDIYRLDLGTKQWEKVIVCGVIPKCFQITGIDPQPFRVHSSCRPCIQFNHKLIVLHPIQKGTSRDQREVLTLSEINLKRRTWTILNVPPDDNSVVNTSARGNPTMNLFDDKLIVLGGHSQYSSARHHITFRELMVADVPRRISWQVERLLWLGHMKNSKETCHLARIPPEMIAVIIEFVNGAALII